MTGPWLIAGQRPQEPAGQRLRELIRRPGIVRVPGAHDGLTARLARRAGFECLYLSGAALSASMALPDLGVISQDELVHASRMICRAAGLPLIVDGDTGYGEALNVMRLVAELEQSGAAAVQLEDQQLPKKCGHLNDKRLVPAEEMARKIDAARRARSDLVIVARTDAAAVGLEEAIRRARLYVEAGADVIFPEALSSDDDFRAVADAVAAPILANMTEFGRTPYRSAADFERLGCKLVIWPVSSLRVAAKAAGELYSHLAETGETRSLLERMQTRAELYEAIGYHDYEALDATIARSAVPETPQ
ncbi:MAG: methylisocitrate lyase [Rhizobiaceae bacterium]|jgi:methylisocitrate lyase|nr:methylisocitrate lyase [Rhizobiaceae bacterium]